MSAEGKVLIELRGDICLLTLNRPEVHNALDAELIESLSHELRVHAGEVKAVILQGAGRSFCAGADLAYMEEAKDFTEKENLEDARHLAGLFHEIRTFPGVVVAAVQGAAIGGGVGLVAACDVVLASRRARFQLSEVRLGLVPAVISPFLIDRMGEGACRAPVLLGYRFDAEEAQRRGLVDRLVEVDDFEQAVLDLIEELSLTAPKALEEAKGLLHRVSHRLVKDVFEDTAQTIARIRVGSEAQEGLQAFLEKRPPSWREDPSEQEKPKGTAMAKKIGVLLSGCGVNDGSEIHEAVVTLLALSRAGAEVVCCAPNKPQMHVIDHVAGAPAEGATRNCMVEAARISRGEIRDLAEVKASDLDALILPGGFGAAKNLCDFAVKGEECTIDPQVDRLLGEMVSARKPIGAICIAPAVVARHFQGKDVQVELTIGTCEGTGAKLEAMGAKHVAKTVNEIHFDEAHKIVSTPAYMLAGSIAEAATGIELLVAKVMEIA